MMRTFLLFPLLLSTSCNPLNPCGGGFSFASSDLRCEPTPFTPPIDNGATVERRSGYAGELWWLPAVSSSWVLDDDIRLTSEIITSNASAVRIPDDLSVGTGHSLASDELTTTVGFVAGVSPIGPVTEADLALSPLPVTTDPASGAPLMSWESGNRDTIVIELWEDVAGLSHENARLILPNMLANGSGFGGTTTASSVSARIVSLAQGEVGPISTIVVDQGEQP
jgi:hypothetical protein